VAWRTRAHRHRRGSPVGPGGERRLDGAVHGAVARVGFAAQQVGHGVQEGIAIDLVQRAAKSSAKGLNL
jgi:hypothetical protein